METSQCLSTIVIISILLHSITCFSAKNITTDANALLALKARITHDPYTSLANNWSTSTSVCNWIGVNCGVRHHRVTALNLAYLNLTGTFPPQLGNLSFLSSLSANDNNFHGSLPYELARLHRLKYINFNHNQLSGNVPSSIFNISSLQELTLKRNQLSSIVNVSNGGFVNLMALDLSENLLEGEIPSFISECTQLQFLNLSCNNFRGIPKEIGNLTKLKTLSIGNNKLRGEIPKELGNLAELERLSLPHNVLLTGQIPSLIFNISSLWLIDFTNNSLTGEILPHNMCSHYRPSVLKVLSLNYNQFRAHIPREIGNLTMLKEVRIGSNNLIGEIPNEVGNLPNLEYLVFGVNNLVGYIPANVFNISTLKWLSLGFNKFSGSLPSNIGFRIPNIEFLHLGSNNLSGTFPTVITNASKLKTLEMGSNKFSGFIPSTIGNGLTSLERLAFSYNYFTSSTQELSFLTSLTNCKNLRVISLSHNPLNGFLPSSILNLSVSLEIFVMSDCKISGNISQEIGNLTNLVTLSMGKNEFMGSIPTTLGKLQKLQGIDLQYNKLKGSIPDALCHLDYIAILYMQGNKFSGAIPACFGNLTTLRVLFLASNRLTSIIPSSFWNLRDILHLNLSTNSLTGTLPLDFGNLKKVVEIDLSMNHLIGSIPSTIGGFQDLQFLSLKFNSLQGLIPESFGGLISLETLDLSYNNLSGVIPNSLENLLYLKFLNLSFNHLEGKIPTKGPFTNFSITSFMMNHALCGLPQQGVPQCKTSIHPKSRIGLVLVLAITLPLTFVAFLALIIVLRKCLKRRDLINIVANAPQQAIWRRISYQELVRATDGFSERNLLGSGSFGSVYKGRLSDGMQIAIKVFHVQLERAVQSFNVECQVLSGIRHRNLIKIISSCTNVDLMALVLEYMPNGSLAKCLYSDEFFLDILQRLNIMIDVALALEYLHFGCLVPIVHCDVKPSNVLLDQSMVGHLSDFGITKLLGKEDSITRTQTLATIGYMAPEYGREGKVSKKGDVYSYGILLMETFTKKKPTDEIFMEEMSLTHWVGDSLNRSIIEVVDDDLLRLDDSHFSTREQCVSSILRLAMDCTANLPKDRINMRNVVSILTKIRATFLSSTSVSNMP